ncbi:MAG: N-acetyltransferase [Deltaproteobacteria bacterium]|nr:N-acetyltransferase [Deltaproteobacteria bacterium]
MTQPPTKPNRQSPPRDDRPAQRPDSSIDRPGQPANQADDRPGQAGPTDQPAPFVHETAIVELGATLGPGTKVWHFCHVMGGARIGPSCIFGQNVFMGDVQVGAGCKVQNNVSLYNGVLLEDHVFVGPSAVFTNVRTPRAHVSRHDEYQHTVVRKGCTIGANATIVCGVTLNEYAFVGAGSVVTHDVPAHAMVYGAPARQAGWSCRCGEILNLPVQIGSQTSANSESIIATCTRCGDRYRLTGSTLTLERDGTKR